MILLLAALAVFGASVGASFHLDDYSMFTRDLWRPLQMRPLTYLTFWLNYQLGGQNPIGYHAVNLALHLTAIALLFHALQRLIPHRAALIGAAIFALHPFVVEPVNYVFERSTILATIFCLAALLAWTRDRWWFATAWFTAALLCKEECVAFPLFLLLMNLAKNRDRREWKAIGVMLALSLAAGVRVFLAGAGVRGSGIGAQAGISEWAYLFTQGTVILRYLRMLIVPWGFTVDPDIPVAHGPLPWLAWAVVIALACGATRRFSRLREGFWFLGGLLLLLPSSSIFPAADLAADRRMYLPLIAFSAALGLGLDRVKNRAIVVAAVAILAILSLLRAQVWLTEESLWTDAATKAPSKVRPKIQLARALGGERGLAVLDDAERIAPDDARIASEEGRIALAMSNPQQALTFFGRALALEPGSATAHNNRGVALLMLGQRDAARSDFERALSIDPCQADARENLLHLGVVAHELQACK